MTDSSIYLTNQLKNTPLEACISGRNKEGHWESYSNSKNVKDTA